MREFDFIDGICPVRGIAPFGRPIWIGRPIDGDGWGEI